MSIGEGGNDLESEVSAVIEEHRATGGGRLRGPEERIPSGQDAVMRIPVAVRIVLGASRMPLSKLLSLNRGSIIPLDRKVGDMVDIVVNDRVVARGEVVVLDEEASRFAVSVREVVVPPDS